MNSSIVRRAKAARRFGLGLMAAGFVPVLWLAAQSVVASAHSGMPDVLAYSPAWPLVDRLSWIPHELRTAFVIAVAGVALMMLGAALARRQVEVLSAAQRHREDSLRRARQYYDDERIEPYIGPGLPGAPQVIRHQQG